MGHARLAATRHLAATGRDRRGQSSHRRHGGNASENSLSRLVHRERRRAGTPGGRKEYINMPDETPAATMPTVPLLVHAYQQIGLYISTTGDWQLAHFSESTCLDPLHNPNHDPANHGNHLIIADIYYGLADLIKVIKLP